MTSYLLDAAEVWPGDEERREHVAEALAESDAAAALGERGLSRPLTESDEETDDLIAEFARGVRGG